MVVFSGCVLAPNIRFVTIRRSVLSCGGGGEEGLLCCRSDGVIATSTTAAGRYSLSGSYQVVSFRAKVLTLKG